MQGTNSDINTIIEHLQTFMDSMITQCRQDSTIEMYAKLSSWLDDIIKIY